jgi:hypothetical protein
MVQRKVDALPRVPQKGLSERYIKHKGFCEADTKTSLNQHLVYLLLLIGQIDPEWMLYNFKVNTVGPMLVAKHFQTLLDTTRKLPSGEKRAVSVLATLSARVGSIGDNRLGGWYSYRISKAAQNQVQV